MVQGDHRGAARAGGWRVAAAALLVAVTGSCAPGVQEPVAAGRQVATYSDPSVYRVGEAKLRRLAAGLDPESPQRVILADGQVTRAELEQAWVAYGQCIDAAGFAVTTSAWDPVTSTKKIFTYARRAAATTPAATPAATSAATPATATASGATNGSVAQVDACEEEHWFPVSAVYAADTAPHMVPALASAVVACMGRRGYDVHGSTSFGEVVGAVSGHARGVRVEAGRDCLEEAMAHLYPDLPYYPRP